MIVEVTGPTFTACDVFAYLKLKDLVTVWRVGVKENWVLLVEARGVLNARALPDESNNLNPTPLSVPSFKATELLPVKTALFVGENWGAKVALADKAPAAQLTVILMLLCTEATAVPAVKLAISERLSVSSVMLGWSIKKLHVGAVDFGTLTTAKVAVEVVVVGWSRSSTEDIWGVKKVTSAEVVLVPSSRYSKRQPTVCPAVM